MARKTTTKNLQAWRPELGAKLLTSGSIERKRDKGKREWVAIEEPVIGYYIGWRILTNGHVEHEYYDFGEGGYSYFVPSGETMEAWLVVTNERREPVYVLPSQVSHVELTRVSDRHYCKIEYERFSEKLRNEEDDEHSSGIMHINFPA